MKTRVAAVVTTLVLGVASISSASAFDRPARHTGFLPYEVETTGSFDRRYGDVSNNPATCPMSSAAEGNAAQQNRTVMQYGQTSGGNRC